VLLQRTVIEALAADRSNHPLYVSSPPRRTWCRQSFVDAHISNLFSEITAEDSIAVAQQVTGELRKGKCLSQLLSCPLRGRVGGNIEVQNAAAVMGQNQENVKNLEADRGHREEINRDQLLDMIFEEGAPSLRRRFVAAQHVSADAALNDVEAEFEQFSLNPGCTPKGILPTHLVDEISDFTRNEGSFGLAAPHLPARADENRRDAKPRPSMAWR